MNDFGTFNNPVWTIQQVIQFYALLGLVAVVVIGFLWYYIINLIDRFQQRRYNKKMSDIEKAINYLKGLNHAPIIEYYNGYIILAQDNLDLEGKKFKINQGYTNGFYTVDRVLNIGSNVEK